MPVVHLVLRVCKKEINNIIREINKKAKVPLLGIESMTSVTATSILKGADFFRVSSTYE
jgi:hypothetical protein